MVAEIVTLLIGVEIIILNLVILPIGVETINLNFAIRLEMSEVAIYICIYSLLGGEARNAALFLVFVWRSSPCTATWNRIPARSGRAKLYGCTHSQGPQRKINICLFLKNK